MLGELLSASLKARLSRSVADAIAALPRDETRAVVTAWLQQAVEIIGNEGDWSRKMAALDSLMGQRGCRGIVNELAAKVLREFAPSGLPKLLRAALPVSLISMPVIGGQGLGLAALGGALGAPALALGLLGTVGLSSILESLAERQRIGGAASLSPWPQAGGRTVPRRVGPAGVSRRLVRRPMPTDEEPLRRALRTMDPYDFECHVMSFFAECGLEAWVTGKTNDMGVDGFARHPQGLIVVQCKRLGSGNLVGRPVIQQMKGVLSEHDAIRGYLVTTSSFSEKARHSARMSGQLVLVDILELVRWHREAPRLSA